MQRCCFHRSIPVLITLPERSVRRSRDGWPCRASCALSGG
ncbi:hypothetical protein I35_1350 [Burkholderia cenocepacia H111]|nr:hypothetical protein I35_1350 [Burkholderia cenocepacia H111]